MAVGSQSSHILRFSTFEVDLHAGELRKNGVRIKLQEQPFLVLKTLLAHPGEIVSREELRSRIWSADTFVDFDNSLNTSINKLREALNDSADHPRFIETLPRRGYRFLVPVNSDQRKERRWLVPTAIAVLASVVVTGVFFWPQRKARLTEKDTIVLADFTNTTSDAVFDDTLKQGLRVQLEQSPFLNILSDEQVDEQLKLMARSAGERLTPELARDLCQRVGSKAVLNGTIKSLGTHYVIGLSALNCHTGVGLASEQTETDSREHVLKSLGEAARKMREKLGESLATTQKYDAPIEQATTTSLEALQVYSLGLKTGRLQGAPAAIPFYKRAVELDPQFAMAYGRLSTAYDMGGNVDLKDETLRKAYDLRNRASERERLYLESHYFHSLTGDLEKAAQVYELWKQIYPRDPPPYDNLQNVYTYQGRHEEALVQGLEVLHLTPDYVSSYEDIVLSLICLNRFEEAHTRLQEAEQRKLDSPLLRWLRYELALFENDFGEISRLEADSNKPGFPWLLVTRAMHEAQLGRFRTSQEVVNQAVRVIQDRGGIESAALFQSRAALIAAYIGNPREARSHVVLSQKLSANRLGEPFSALALALANNVTGAEQLCADLDRRWPEDSVVQHYWLPTIRAAIALDRRNAEDAIGLLSAMGTYEMSLESDLDPIYLRGRAFLVQGNSNAAVTEFTKIIMHPGLVMQSPVGVLAHLGIARAYALQGENGKAHAAYQDFFTLWKDADQDIPILQQAKAEYAKLQ
jgi:DNA-binding winged helix-turn-helix (wHTH) protein/tetratricopeptide (TPR) repeat protein